MKSLFGYGITTKEIAKEGGWHIYDDKFKEISFDKYGNKLLPSSLFDENKSKLEITSPGIPPYHPLIKKAKNLMSELDYYYNPQTFQIWISGTNGKTTTTEMLHYLLPQSEIGGNIGIPLGKLNKNKIWVLEVSSFQLYYTKYAKPNIFILLPLSKDHIAWHGSFDEYKNAKLSPLKKMTKRDIAILPKELNSQTDAFKILYENENDLIKYFDIKKTEFKRPFLLDELLAKAVYKILYFKEKDLKNFQIDPHKLEEFKDNKNRIWVDDSKATNIDATFNALKRYKNKKIHLIIGGDDKGQNFEKLFEFMKNLDITLYIIGKKREIFIKLAKEFGISFINCETLENAVKKIDTNLKKNEIALLSPACASLDQFENYKKRGEIFKKLVLCLF